MEFRLAHRQSKHNIIRLKFLSKDRSCPSESIPSGQYFIHPAYRIRATFLCFLNLFPEERWSNWAELDDIAEKLDVMICELFVALAVAVSGQTVRDTSGIVAVFWNLENFFDYEDGGGGDSDREFSPGGTKHWTASKFYRKCDAVAKSLLWMEDAYGRIPDVLGVAEVENRSVPERMLRNTLLRKYGYSVLHRESPDHRGIDVALLYRKSTFRCIASGIRRLDSMATRDILFADLEVRKTGERIAFAVNHFPSKYGGPSTSGRRNAASVALYSLCDSIISSGTSSVVAMGDFNDVPSSPVFNPLKPLMLNLSEPFENAGEGTIRFNGKWDMIDMFWVSPALYGRAEMDIVRLPFLMVWDNVHPGFKPLRTYSGPRYLGGVSDHCPVLLRLR